MSADERPSRRADLSYADDESVIADVERLRRGGYARLGNWSLAQVCWHLAVTTRLRMAPGPHPPTTPDQAARQEQLARTLATGRLPDGIVAPDAIRPPPDAGDGAVDDYIATLRRFRDFTGEIAPHRLFGHMPDADIRRLNRIHAAHHLSFLVPRA